MSLSETTHVVYGKRCRGRCQHPASVDPNTQKTSEEDYQLLAMKAVIKLQSIGICASLCDIHALEVFNVAPELEFK